MSGHKLLERALSAVRWARLLLLGLSLLLLPAGCGAIGYVASAVAGDETVEASYKGLAGQTVAIVVWARQGVCMDYNMLPGDVALSLNADLYSVTYGKDAKSELKGVRYVDPRAVLRWQKNHPELDGAPIEQIAPKLGASRVIYVEINEFQTHSPLSPDLLRGRAVAMIKVLEVGPKGPKAAFTESDITALYPPNSVEGVGASEDTNEAKVYDETVKAFAAEIACRFIEHPAVETPGGTPPVVGE